MTTLRHYLRAVPPLAWLLLLTSACVLPFAQKAFHIDDTLFIRVAEQIQKHPADFYGFNLNWFGKLKPMVDNFDNPPLACYYLALVAGLGGWSELFLHLAFLLPALAATWGVFSLAKLYTNQPLPSAVVAIITPVFLISATTVMCDVMVLAFWIWSLVFFEKGLREKQFRSFLLSGVLAGLAYYTKFTALALVPLLAAYGLFHQRRIGIWIVAALLPVLFAGAYEWVTYRLYGQGLLMTAFGVATRGVHSEHKGLFQTFVVGLSFLGGCFLPVLFLAPWLWTGRSLLRGLLIMTPVLLLFPYQGKFVLLWDTTGRTNWLLCAQSALFIAAGMHILLLALSDLWKSRNAVSVLLLLWVVGIFVFATKVNWTINGRSLLPMLPAVGILVGRRLDQRSEPAAIYKKPGLALAVLAGAMVSLLTVNADYHLANSARQAARDICQKHLQTGHTLWFQGHWGFQYYMEQRGAKALDSQLIELKPKDVVIIPSEGVSTFDMSTNLVRFTGTFEYAPNPYFSTTSLSAGAGFYAAVIGPFPFSLGRIEPERYYVFEATHSRDEVTNWQLMPFESGVLGQRFDIERLGIICQDTLRANPNNIEAHLHLGAYYRWSLKEKEAAQQFSEVLRLDPNNSLAHLELASILKHQGQTTEAIRHYRAVLGTQPDSIRALRELAWILATSQQAQFRNGSEALRLAQRANELTDENSADAQTVLAAAYAEAGWFDRATIAAKQASQIALSTGDQTKTAQGEKLSECFHAGRPFRE